MESDYQIVADTYKFLSLLVLSVVSMVVSLTSLSLFLSLSLLGRLRDQSKVMTANHQQLLQHNTRVCDLTLRLKEVADNLQAVNASTNRKAFAS